MNKMIRSQTLSLAFLHSESYRDTYYLSLYLGILESVLEIPDKTSAKTPIRTGF